MPSTPHRTHEAPPPWSRVVPCCGRPVRTVSPGDLRREHSDVTCDGTYTVGQGETLATVTRLLDFERKHPRSCGAKDEAIRHELGTTPANYYVLLGRVIDTDDAIAIDPIFTRHLRAQRDRRIATRTARTHGRTHPADSI